jgi:hypothetical protein
MHFCAIGQFPVALRVTQAAKAFFKAFLVILILSIFCPSS